MTDTRLILPTLRLVLRHLILGDENVDDDPQRLELGRSGLRLVIAELELEDALDGGAFYHEVDKRGLEARLVRATAELEDRGREIERLRNCLRGDVQPVRVPDDGSCCGLLGIMGEGAIPVACDLRPHRGQTHRASDGTWWITKAADLDPFHGTFAARPLKVKLHADHARLYYADTDEAIAVVPLDELDPEVLSAMRTDGQVARR